MIHVFEPSDSRMFTFVSSVAPDSAPVFKVWEGSAVSCMTSISSDSTHYYAIYTMPSSIVDQSYYIGEWYALKTVAGSAHTFVRKLIFGVGLTRTP